MLNFNQVWSLYHRYYSPKRLFPDSTFPRKTPKRGTSLIDFADEYDVLLLDGFGVLNIGDASIPLMSRTIRELQAMGKEAFVLTNGASHPSKIRAKNYPKLGYDIPQTHIISSRDAVEANIADHPISKAGGVWGTIVLQQGHLETIPANCIHLSYHNMDDVDGFIFLGTTYWDDDWQAMLLKSLQKNKRPVLVGNPDISAPLEDSFSIEPGYYMLELLRQIPDLEVEYYGKPFQNVYVESMKKINTVLGNVDISRILMVGDTLHTDILGGNQAGMKTALKSDWGFLRNHDPEPFIEESGIYPDYIISHR